MRVQFFTPRKLNQKLTLSHSSFVVFFSILVHKQRPESVTKNVLDNRSVPDCRGVLIPSLNFATWPSDQLKQRLIRNERNRKFNT